VQERLETLLEERKALGEEVKRLEKAVRGSESSGDRRSLRPLWGLPMLILIFAFLVFFFLLVGAVQFLVCVAVPRLRRYALSAALWWAVWGPCSTALLMLAGAGLIAQHLFAEHGRFASGNLLPSLAALGWIYLTVGTLGTSAVATAIAWLHQALVRRFTFALFRLYAAAVSGGIGSVFGWCLAYWCLGSIRPYGWVFALCGMVALVILFAMWAYRNARGLRGSAPTGFTWVSREEFEGEVS
jgi:hypothetical protein